VLFVGRAFSIFLAPLHIRLLAFELEWPANIGENCRTVIDPTYHLKIATSANGTSPCLAMWLLRVL
jgi:hypothetical protein